MLDWRWVLDEETAMQHGTGRTAHGRAGPAARWAGGESAILGASLVLGLLVAVLGAAQGVPAAGLPTTAGAPDPPDVVGLTLEAAIAELHASEWDTERAYAFGGYRTIPETVGDPARAGVVGQWTACSPDPGHGDDVCVFTLSVEAVVPELRDLSLAQARQEAAAADLEVAPDDPEAPDSWTVTDQEPQPGETLPFHGAVHVALGPDPLPALPDLVGWDLTAARGALDALADERRAALPTYSQEVRTDPSEVPVDEDRAFVANQPDDCALPIRVCVLELALQARVPALVGLTLAEAEDELGTAGLALAASVDRADPQRTVDTQSPDAGELAPFGAVVDVSSAAGTGPWPRLPHLVGLTLAQAERALDRVAAERADAVAGYAQQVTTEPAVVPVSGDHAVVAAEPRDCPERATDCAITLAVRAVVPDVRGGTLAEARAALADAGLTLAEPSAGTEQDASVTDQDPQPGQPARFGDAVSVVAAGRTTSTAPSQPEEGAEATQREDGSPVGLALGLAAALLAAGIGTWAARGRHSRRWVGQHVRVTADPGEVVEDIRDVPGTGGSHSVSITTESGPPLEEVEEVDRP